VGILIDTSFGEEGRLHALVGARVVAPRSPEARILPYARAEVEEGQVGRRFFGPRDLDVRLEYRSDDQFYGRDKTALLLLAGVSF
jgi:hypothetical protein